MKALISALFVMFASPAFACSLSPIGASSMRISAVLAAVLEEEQNSLSVINAIQSKDLESNIVEVKLTSLENGEISTQKYSVEFVGGEGGLCPGVKAEKIK